MGHRIHQILYLSGEHALHGTNGTAGGLFRAAFNQIGNGLGLGQVQFVVQKRPLGKLTRAGQSCSLAAHFPQQKIEDHSTAVALKLEHILTGERVRVGEKQPNTLINQLTLAVVEGTVMGVSGFRLKPKHFLRYDPGPWSGYANNADTGLSRRGGNGCDSVRTLAHAFSTG